MIKNKLKYILVIIIAIGFVYACSDGGSDSSSSSSTGKGGSLARFAIVNDRLYAVDNMNLKTFNISDSSNVFKTTDSYIGMNIETLFPGDTCLYIGSQNGMYVFSLKNPDIPTQKMYLQHIYSCDPVVSDGKYGYVTLSSTSRCGHSTNELQVYDLNPLNPSLKTTISMKQPKGLGLYKSALYVCDDNKIKVYDVSNPISPKPAYSVTIAAKDVIPSGDILIAVGDNILTQYKIQGFSLTQLSTISTNAN